MPCRAASWPTVSRCGATAVAGVRFGQSLEAPPAAATGSPPEAQDGQAYVRLEGPPRGGGAQGGPPHVEGSAQATERKPAESTSAGRRAGGTRGSAEKLGERAPMGKPLSGRAPRPRAEGGNEKRKFCMFHLQGICRKSTQECPWAHSIEEMESSRSRAKKKASPARDDSASWPSESSSSPAPPLWEAVQAATAAQKHCRPPQTSTAPALAATHVMDGGVDMIAGSTRRGDPRLLNLSPEPVLTPERGMYYRKPPPGAQGAAPVPLPELPLDWPAGGLSPQGPPDEPTAPKHPSEPPPSALGAGLLRLGVGWPGPPPGLEDLGGCGRALPGLSA
ncbi:unnamed protein product [Prorocentrum cordatum]|uniref:C3H1-type domain-containing protein n=1 Tax=Prorocentrum cordatum TaxID=2364126 RepID=A0ABN9S754_9DINO|nr:unnamed protein product [Polarella glacialis]